MDLKRILMDEALDASGKMEGLVHLIRLNESRSDEGEAMWGLSLILEDIKKKIYRVYLALDSHSLSQDLETEIEIDHEALDPNMALIKFLNRDKSEKQLPTSISQKLGAVGTRGKKNQAGPQDNP